MGYEGWIAKRYLWSKRRHPFVGVTSTISVLGIGVGVAALIVVLAVMNGFDGELKDRIIGTRAHLVIEKEEAFNHYAGLLESLSKLKGIAGASPFVEGQALIQKDEWGTGVLVRGIDSRTEKSVSKFYQYLKDGTLSGREKFAVVGSELARRFNLKIGSQFLVLSQTAKKPAVYTVEGVFSSGLYEYDANLLFLNLKDAQELFDMKEAVSGVSVALSDAGAADFFKRGIQDKLKYPYVVRTWMDMNKTLFGALKLEKIVMFLILALIILVACLNIAGSLTMLVMDKTKDIGVLRALGATRFSILKIFALDGLWMGFFGAGAGFLAGTALCVILAHTPLVDLPKEIYYVSRLPIKANPVDVALVLSVAVALSFVSSLYPAVTAGRLTPAQALRHE